MFKLCLWGQNGTAPGSPGTWSAFYRYLYVSFRQNSGERFRATWTSCFRWTRLCWASVLLIVVSENAVKMLVTFGPHGIFGSINILIYFKNVQPLVCKAVTKLLGQFKTWKSAENHKLAKRNYQSKHYFKDLVSKFCTTRKICLPNIPSRTGYWLVFIHYGPCILQSVDFIMFTTILLNDFGFVIDVWSIDVSLAKSQRITYYLYGTSSVTTWHANQMTILSSKYSDKLG